METGLAGPCIGSRLALNRTDTVAAHHIAAGQDGGGVTYNIAHVYDSSFSFSLLVRADEELIDGRRLPAVDLRGGLELLAVAFRVAQLGELPRRPCGLLGALLRRGRPVLVARAALFPPRRVDEGAALALPLVVLERR